MKENKSGCFFLNTVYMEFAGIHHKLYKQGLFNLNAKRPHFQSVPFNRPRPTNKTVADDSISQIRTSRFDSIRKFRIAAPATFAVVP